MAGGDFAAGVVRRRSVLPHRGAPTHSASWPGIAVRRTASLRSPMTRPSIILRKRWTPGSSPGVTIESVARLKTSPLDDDHLEIFARHHHGAVARTVHPRDQRH